MSSPRVYTSTGALTDLAKIFREHFEKPFVRALGEKVTLVKLFGTKSGVGHEAQWIVHYDRNNSAVFYREDDVIGAPGKQAYERARKPYKMARITYGASGLAIAATKSDEAALVRVLAEEARRASLDLLYRIDGHLLGINPNPVSDEYARVEMDCLGDIIRDTGVYATIDRTTATWWRSVVLANGGTPRPLTLGLFQQMRAQLEAPPREAEITHILTSRVHFDQYGNLLEDRRRWVNVTKADGGFEALEYDSIPVIVIPRMAAGAMFWVNKADWSYEVLLPFETDQVPVNTDREEYVIKTYANLICRHPGRQGAIRDLQTT
jgi:hypothetical protein